MAAEAFINNTIAGLNNPDCAFYVGAMAGQMGIAYLIIRVMIIYFGIKLLEKLTFVGIPKFYKWLKVEMEIRRLRK